MLNTVFDALCALIRGHCCRIDFNIVDHVDMHHGELRRGLARGAVAAGTFARHQHLERAAHTHQVNREVREQVGAFHHPTRVNQHMVGDNIVTGACQGCDGVVHPRKQALPGSAGGHRQPENVIS